MAAAGSGAHAGFADSRAIPVWLSGSLSIHADDSILLQKYLYLFLKKRREYIHNLKKGAGVPHVYIRDLQTIPIPSPPFHQGAGENCWTTGLLGGIGEGNRIEAEAV